MHLQFESPDPQAAQLRDLAHGRAQFALRRLAWLVPRVSVHLIDVNGPRGGVDKRCQVEIKTSRHGVVVVTAMAGDWRSALDRAFERARQVLLRSWQRAREHKRTSRRAITVSN